MKIKIVKSSTLDTRINFIVKETSHAIPDFKADRGEIAVRYEGEQTVVYCGLGEGPKISIATLRSAAAGAMQKAASLKRGAVCLIEPQLAAPIEGAAAACLEGALLGSYSFTKYKSEKPQGVVKCEFVTTSLSSRQAEAVAAVCTCVDFARDLVNDNAATITPQRLAKEAKELADGKTLSCTVLTEKEIERQGLGLLQAVGQGSPYPPRLILLQYTGKPGLKHTSAIVGKGITFDCGGQNLKTSGHIETMRTDMAGAAAVLGLMKALTLLKPKINVIGVIPAAHNALDGQAYFPGDVYRSFCGKTVEISNTDAEGRLVLADAISYVLKHHQPSEIIDLATLTGAIVVALGDTVAGLFSNDDALAQRLTAAGEKTGERLWRMPLGEEHSDAIKGDLADLRNTGKKKGQAGSSVGAAFLKEFVGELPWAHLDIAGTAFNEGEARGEIPRFATGFGIRLLLQYLQNRE